MGSILRHNTSGASSSFSPDDYCVIALYGDREGHGVLVGNKNARCRLIVLNTSDIHFDPCLPLGVPVVEETLRELSSVREKC